jgi:DNA-binding NarL/FixJ family response regulator
MNAKPLSKLKTITTQTDNAMRRTRILTPDAKDTIVAISGLHAKKLISETASTYKNGGLNVTSRASNDLTPHERSIALLVSQGKTNSEIAGALFIAPGTVRNYVSSILSKLYLANRASLAVWVVQNNLAAQIIGAYERPVTISNPDCYKDLIFGVYT